MLNVFQTELWRRGAACPQSLLLWAGRCSDGGHVCCPPQPDSKPDSDWLSTEPSPRLKLSCNIWAVEDVCLQNGPVRGFRDSNDFNSPHFLFQGNLVTLNVLKYYVTVFAVIVFPLQTTVTTAPSQVDVLNMICGRRTGFKPASVV